MSDKPDYHKSYTYTIKIDPKKYSGVLYSSITLPVDVDFIIEKKLEAMKGVYVDANQILQRIKNERKD